MIKTYSTDALFTSTRAYSARFYTDRGIQLSKAGTSIDSKEEPVNWTWGKLEQVLAAKKTFKIMMPRGSACFNFTKFTTLQVKCAKMINSCPIGLLLVEDDLHPLTLNYSLIG